MNTVNTHLPSVRRPLHQRFREITLALETINDTLCAKPPTQQISIFAYVLIYIQVLVVNLGDDSGRIIGAIATLQQSPMYTECCQALEGNSELLERFEEMFQPSSELNTQEACNDYSVKIHQLYADIMRYLTNSPQASL